jgi:hypothetical protein
MIGNSAELIWPQKFRNPTQYPRLFMPLGRRLTGGLIGPQESSVPATSTVY